MKMVKILSIQKMVSDINVIVYTCFNRLTIEKFLKKVFV